MATTKGVNATAVSTDDPFLFVTAADLAGNMRVSMDVAAVAAADFDADGDIVYLAQVPSNARIVSIKTYNDDLDSGTDSAVNVGIYNGDEAFVDTDASATAYAADALIDEDAYAAASSALQAAVTAGTEHAFGTAARRNDPLRKVWEDAGLDSDPQVPLRIALTQTATVSGAQAGDIVMVVTYVID
jgi:hypothetical protein